MKKTMSLTILSLTYSSLLLATASTNLVSSFSTYTQVREPSALSFSNDKKTLYTVSDNNGVVYQLDLTGKVLKEIKTPSSDLEGIVVHQDLGGFCVVEERVRNVVCYDMNGKEKNRKSINFQGESNSGFEGITYNPKNKNFYIVNEKKPMMILTLDHDLNIINKIEFNQSKDLSDIYYDEELNKFWLLSHESKEIYLTDLDFNIEKTYGIPNIIQAEGISVDSKNKKIFIISDKDSNFSVYNF